MVNAIVRRNGGPASPRSLGELTLLEDARPAVERLRAAGFRVFVVTNQPDVARGRLSREALHDIERAVRARLPIDDYRACTHDDPDGCACRKPEPGMVLDLADAWNVDLAASFVVGDRWKDIAAGRAAGCRTVLLQREYSGDADADLCAGDLSDAVDWILGMKADEPLSYAAEYLDETRRIVDALDAGALDAMAEALADLRDRGGRLFLIGAGGGAGHASHAVADFRKIAGIEAYSPADNVSELTARVNDEGWETVFVEYLRGARLDERDGVFVFSVGGGDAERGISANLVHALDLAKERGATIFGVVGRDGGHTARVGDHVIVVPSVNERTVTPHTEGFQAVVWHLLVSHPLVRRFGMKWESVAAGHGDG